MRVGALGWAVYSESELCHVGATDVQQTPNKSGLVGPPSSAVSCLTCALGSSQAGGTPGVKGSGRYRGVQPCMGGTLATGRAGSWRREVGKGGGGRAETGRKEGGPCSTQYPLYAGGGGTEETWVSAPGLSPAPCGAGGGGKVAATGLCSSFQLRGTQKPRHCYCKRDLAETKTQENVRRYPDLPLVAGSPCPLDRLQGASAWPAHRRLPSAPCWLTTYQGENRGCWP